MPTVNGTASSSSAAFASSLTFAHTVAEGSNRALLVAVAAGDVISSVTYDGTAMTAVETGNTFYRLFSLLAPTVGTANVVVTLAGPNALIAIAEGYNGVDQTTPYDGTQASATGGETPSVTVTSRVGDLVVGMSARSDNNPTTVQSVGAGQTSIASLAIEGLSLIASREAGAVSVVHSYTRPAGFFYNQHLVAISLRNASGGGGGTTRRLGFVRPARRG